MRHLRRIVIGEGKKVIGRKCTNKSDLYHQISEKVKTNAEKFLLNLMEIS